MMAFCTTLQQDDSLCSGGFQYYIKFDAELEEAPAGRVPLALQVAGLVGGHSGTVMPAAGMA